MRASISFDPQAHAYPSANDCHPAKREASAALLLGLNGKAFPFVTGGRA
ncbi:MAG: hypothetical protein JRJ29_22070 [Deltaproteobacteria bacterium]|nr:hypothetical protein [Deltaproteobacteria bacterium]